MEIVFTVLILLLAVAVSGVVARLMPFKLPLPLFQIALGAVLALPLFGLRISFDPDLFLLLFIPPLLFTDGWRMPKREFFRLARPILALALGLVLFTVIGVGYFIHWMIPVISLPSAFALAAVLSPTDAVAVSSIVGKGRLPASMQHVLEGEALMNDASGLVAFKFAVAAVITGSFSLVDASLSFVLISVGGIAVGLIVAWGFGLIRRKIIEWAGDEPGIQVVLLLLIPFTAYIFAEHFGLSGILAAVAAGMLMPYIETAGGESAATRIQGHSIMTMLEFVFNGMSFLLLGLQLPGIVSLAHVDAKMAGNVPVWHLFVYILAITVALIVLRFVWVWINLRMRRFASALRGQSGRNRRFDLRLISITALSGVRGAITLAGVMSIPLLLSEHKPFPARDLLIFLATGVIVCSLLFGSFLLPWLLKDLQLDAEVKRRRAEEMMARLRLSEAAVRSIETAQERLGGSLDETDLALLTEVSGSLLATYRMRMNAESDSEDTQRAANRFKQFERELRLEAIRAERLEVHYLRAEQRINDETFLMLINQIDMAETWLLGSLNASNQHH
ncbi:Na+/H+ antiporter [Herbaspirillum sp. NPDC087042]|uniref:Na+/H+ antiporter n=1 Tax=Herbaspirillum sp. NPDC087042 TaxID=3364004 RepID=UPI003806B5F4